MRPELVIPSLDKIRAARLRIAGIAVRTPLVPVDLHDAPFSQRLTNIPRDVRLKLETAQPIGSFKVRGAANAMAMATPESMTGGVWTASAGNMAQGVAYVARERRLPCRVIVPEHAPRAKTDAVENLGAEVVRVRYARWWNALLSHAYAGMDGLMIHPFADADVMAGNGTIGLEIAEEFADVDAVLVPWGGGGLAIGIAAALRGVSPRAMVYAVEVETAAPLTASLAAGAPVTVPRTPTFIDGMGSDRISGEIWPHVAGLIAGTVVVTVAQVATALRLLVERTGVVAEGAGAAALAAALGGRVNGVEGVSLDAERVACVVSGGNIERGVVERILRGEVP